MFVHFVFHSSLLSSVFQPHDMLAYFKTSLILTWTPLCTFPPWIPVDVDNWYSIRFWPNMSSMTKRCSKTVPLFLHSFTDEGRLLSFNQPFLPLDHRSCQIMNWVTFVSPILNSTHEWLSFENSFECKTVVPDALLKPLTDVVLQWQNTTAHHDSSNTNNSFVSVA